MEKVEEEQGQISSDEESPKTKNKLISNEKIVKKRKAREDSSSSSDSGSSDSSGSSSTENSSSEEEGELKVKRIKVEMNTATTSYTDPNIMEKKRETVPQYLMKNLGIKEEEKLSFIFKRDLNTINNLLNGKHMSALYGKKPINFVYGGLTMTGANRTFAFMRGPTVEQYIKKKQQITLKHPEWPCLIQPGGGNHKSYYPIEVIHI